MQKGEIVEQGKHQELLDQQGVYSNLSRHAVLSIEIVVMLNLKSLG